MTSQQKVLEVERQVRAMIAGEQEPTFQCPYCGLGSNPENGLLCCDAASEAVSVVLDHIDHIERTEVIEKTMDRLSSFQNRSMLN